MTTNIPKLEKDSYLEEGEMDKIFRDYGCDDSCDKASTSSLRRDFLPFSMLRGDIAFMKRRQEISCTEREALKIYGEHGSDVTFSISRTGSMIKFECTNVKLSSNT